jgi:septum formation protein
MTEFRIDYSEDVRRAVAKLVAGRHVRLASGSPRRSKIMRMLGLKFEQFTPEGEDEVATNNASATPVVRSVAIAKHKAAAGAAGLQHGIVVAADTIVVLHGSTLGKPVDRLEAASHLRRLSGQDHIVYTTVVIRDIDHMGEVSGTEQSVVTFKSITERQIADYVSSGEPDDKAGAYGIQGMGQFLVDKYTGNLDNIIGLPVQLLVELLKR